MLLRMIRRFNCLARDRFRCVLSSFCASRRCFRNRSPRSTYLLCLQLPYQTHFQLFRQNFVTYRQIFTVVGRRQSTSTSNFPQFQFPGLTTNLFHYAGHYGHNISLHRHPHWRRSSSPHTFFFLIYALHVKEPSSETLFRAWLNWC